MSLKIGPHTPLSSRFWADLRTTDFAQLGSRPPPWPFAALLWGATEQHRPHLPLAVDRDLVDGIVASRGLPQLADGVPAGACIADAAARSYSPEHAQFAGNIAWTLASAGTVIAAWVWKSVSVSRAPASASCCIFKQPRRPGEPSVDIVARELRTRRDLIVYGCKLVEPAPGSDAVTGLFPPDEQPLRRACGRHRNLADMLRFAPSIQVRMEQARHFALQPRSNARGAGTRCWETAAAPSWAGPWRRTTTRKARPAMPRPPPRREGPRRAGRGGAQAGATGAGWRSRRCRFPRWWRGLRTYKRARGIASILRKAELDGSHLDA